MSFDRIKPPDQRLLERSDAERPEAEGADPVGRAALFSAGRPVAARRGLAVHCSRCESTAVVDGPTALRCAAPLFLLAPWKDHPIFAVCPTCRHRAWLRPVYAGR